MGKSRNTDKFGKWRKPSDNKKNTGPKNGTLNHGKQSKPHYDSFVPEYDPVESFQ
jgi:hypothetical protein